MKTDMEQFAYYGTLIDIYRKYGIRSFPIDVFSLAIRMGYDVRRYSNLSSEKLEKILRISPSACLLSRTVFYNDGEPLSRIRFSICHEIAHDILETEDEDLADLFASELLAPSIIIRIRCRTADEVSEMFGLSISAANRALYRGNHFVTHRLAKDHPIWQIRDWFEEPKEKNHEARITQKPKEVKQLSPSPAEGNRKLTHETQKKIASIHRRRRKITKKLEIAEEQGRDLERFDLIKLEMDFQRFGGGL